jgi:hypothetical protein
VEVGACAGLGLDDFRRISANGFGDGHNSFAHSMAWFKGRLFVGTTRSNFQMLKVQQLFQGLPVHAWPVDGPDDAKGLYTLDRRAEIWQFDPTLDAWHLAFKAPLVEGLQDERLTGGQGGLVARETGYRAMVVYQGASDPEPALYIATWAVSRSPGSCILRTYDGERFEQVTPYGIIAGLPITATRIIVPFNGRLYTSPQGTRGFDKTFQINVAGLPLVFETEDPASGVWRPVSVEGFGDPANQGIFTMAAFGDHLYAGTFNCNGFQLWKSRCLGEPPYEWVKVIERGADRGPLNQAVASMIVVHSALYLGTGIQNGGADRVNRIGPAGSELIRVRADDSWDLIVGDARNTAAGRKTPLSGLMAGFGNMFNGYFWALGAHDGWLYVGTMDSTIWVRWLTLSAYPRSVQDFIELVGIESIVESDGGCDLWRSADGENFVNVTRNGFDNRYNLGIRNFVSTPFGLFVALANPFGPKVAVRNEETQEWGYIDNPRGGLEIWLGSKPWYRQMGRREPGPVVSTLPV